MNELRLGCIADDYTGATDLSAMLVREGFRVIQCFGIPTADECDALLDADAIVIALKSRSIAANEAVEQSLAALRLLRSQGVTRFFFKYCSTFDSTRHGNIGPVADALADELNQEIVFFCPAFPENGRTVYCGHLFVDGVPLHESGMRHHPLNPMNDSNLVRVLQWQSYRRVLSLPLSDELPPSSPVHYVVDAINDEDLKRVAERAKSHTMMTGGSAIAGRWASEIGVRRSGAYPITSLPGQTNPPRVDRPGVILAGSCSDATARQMTEFESRYPVLRIEIEEGFDVPDMIESTVDWCQQNWQHAGQPIAVSSGTKTAIRTNETATKIESFFAGLAVALRDEGVTQFIVAGGETSGAVVNALAIRAVRIGPEISPGVPWVTSVGPNPMLLALKSGNFGGDRFFLDALESRS
ncbi:3-oxo-tetronate kinase [Neorhodopirellula pilleata]|uniref:3-oxo-tetronate kinase n=1 Tax=Neorhodopirellula pilleata TaxID=2714738 RepID=A0A5C6A2U7_9BACT|nr:3-oxo-tetronate kinase [Neorhodopirellula pilleata]TWT93578.1 hypothetical protein Pla100_40960 [Neorhodopirellula pilleata]